MFRLENITKKYKNSTIALCDINLQIQKNEFVFLIGESGSGKTTLIDLISMKTKPNKGKIYLDGEDILDTPCDKLYIQRRKMGLVFQDFKLLEKRTVFDNVAFTLQIAQKDKKYIKKRVNNVLKIVKLSKKQDAYPRHLSAGEKQKVAIARAIANEPEIIVADEPTGNLDPYASKEIIRLFHNIYLKGTTVLIATHEKEIVDKYKKRVIKIHKGKIVSDTDKGEYI